MPLFHAIFIIQMKIISWNVNGIRAVHKKGLFVPFVEKYKPDILCLQETKAKEFYIKALAPLGYTNNMEYGEAAGFIEGGHTSFWIGTNPKGVVPGYVAFEVKSKEQMDEFYKEALAAGARREKIISGENLIKI